MNDRTGIWISILVLILLAVPVGARGIASRQQDPQRSALEEGQAAFRIPDFDTARRAFRRAARRNPSDPAPHVWLGRCDLVERTDSFDREDRLERALGHIDDALDLDPRSMEARYWKARVLATRGGGRRLDEAREIYEGLVEEDPLYEDVMRRLLEIHVERGTLTIYGEELEEAARTDPDNPVLLYRFAEVLRQSGDLGRAEALLRVLHERHRDFAPGWVNLSYALTLFELGRNEEGTRYYNDAVAFMKYPAVARTMWDDAVWIAKLDEFVRFNRAETIEEYRNILRAFWKSRDPTKTTADNERIGVHYERLRVAWRDYRLAGVRAAWNDPDELGLLNLPPTYNIEAPFDDMGLIYIRWGEPDERAHCHDVSIDNMSWKYEEKGQRPEMIFHFEQHPLGGGWRYVPMPRPGEYALSRVSLDPKYGMIVDGIDVQSQSFLVADANRDLRVGLTQDAYVPEIDAVPLTVFNDEASFKLGNGLSRYEAYWAIPAEELVSQAVIERGEVMLTVNISLFDGGFNELYRTERTSRIPVQQLMVPGSIITDQEVIAVPPGDYMLALQITEVDGDHMQIQDIPARVREYPAGELGISDVEIASLIIQGQRGKFAKSGYSVVPLPTRVYGDGQPVHIYFDIYGLTKDEFLATRYRVSYRLEPGAGESGSIGRVRIGGRLGRRQETGGIEVILDEESGITNDVNKVLEIDLEDSTFRTYRLRITVEDLVAGTSVVRQTFFHVDRSRR